MLYLATTNPNKVKEIKSILRGFGFNGEIAALDIPEVDEVGYTFDEISENKAVYAGQFTSNPVMVEDSGLEVFSLGNLPGIRSKRFTGSDDSNIRKVLYMLRGIDNRGAKFVSSVSIAVGDDVFTYNGEIYGSITEEPRGTGFAYDPIFIPDGYDKTFAELDISVKNRISHRAIALKKSMKLLKELG